MDDTTADLDAIRMRVEATTGDSWIVDNEIEDPDEVYVHAKVDWFIDQHNGHRMYGAREIVRLSESNFNRADAEFIAHARTDVPALLAEVDRLRAERDTLAAELDRDRHEFEPSRGPFGCCGNDREAAAVHRTSRVVLADHTQEG